MGGIGSGSWSRYDSKRTVESCRSIDIRWLVREGIVEPGVWRLGSLKWSDPDTGEERSSIGYVVDTRENDTGTMRLHYTHMPGGPEEAKLDYPVRLVTTRPHLGGVRWWFICPLVVSGRPCGRHVAKLYRRKYYGCRTCHGLVYRSSQEAHQRDRVDNMLQRMWLTHGGFPDPATASPGELLLMLRAMDR